MPVCVMKKESLQMDLVVPPCLYPKVVSCIRMFGENYLTYRKEKTLKSGKIKIVDIQGMPYAINALILRLQQLDAETDETAMEGGNSYILFHNKRRAKKGANGVQEDRADDCEGSL